MRFESYNEAERYFLNCHPFPAYTVEEIREMHREIYYDALESGDRTEHKIHNNTHTIILYKGAGDAHEWWNLEKHFSGKVIFHQKAVFRHVRTGSCIEAFAPEDFDNGIREFVSRNGVRAINAIDIRSIGHILQEMPETWPDYSRIQPDTVLYRVMGNGGYPGLPLGKTESGYWTTSLEAANRILDTQIEECEGFGYALDAKIVARAARDGKLNPMLGLISKTNHNPEFDEDEVFVEGWDGAAEFEIIRQY